jgi:hypothetical protein
MVPASYHAFFGDCAEVAGSLIGLLFVAVSLSPEKPGGADSTFQVRAGTAFAVLTNGLVVSLVALLPGTNLALVCTILSGIGISSCVGLAVISYRNAPAGRRLQALLRVAATFALFAVQLVVAATLWSNPHHPGSIGTETTVIVAGFAFAIERAWELVGVGDSGLISVFRQGLVVRRGLTDPAPPPAPGASTATSAGAAAPGTPAAPVDPPPDQG